MKKSTPTKTKLVAYLKKKYPNIKDEELPLLLKDIQRFVVIVQKIYNEPQAKISIKEVEENGKKVKKRFIDTNIEELLKIKRNTNEPITVKTIRELTEKVLKVKYKKHGE